MERTMMSTAAFVILMLFVVHILWVLLPLVPAILIYKLFPDSLTELVGKIAGYSIKAGGAFAAYLAVVIMTYTQIDSINRAIHAYKHQFWTVVGEVQLANAKGDPIKADQLIKALKVVMRPEPHSVDKYELRLKIVEDPHLPLTVLRIENFGEEKINWKNAPRDYANGIIEVKKITIREDLTTNGPVSLSPARLEAGRDASSSR
jgi:hypothetical protein